MDVKERIAAKKAAKAPAPSAATSRAQRFRSAGVGIDEDDPSDEVPSPARPTAETPAASTPLTWRPPTAPTPVAPQHALGASRAERFKGTALAAAKRAIDSPAPATAPEQDRPAQPISVQAPPWDDANRPAGSSYTEDEWLQAEKDNPGLLIMEMIKPTEHGLIAIENNAANLILKRSLVIDTQVDTPWVSLATCKVEHYSEFGVFRYAVIRSAAEAERSPWLAGSKLAMKTDGYQEQERTPQQASRSQRFRGS